MNKQWFYNQAAPFLDNGLMYEIYSSDVVCICNVANASYAVFNFVPNQYGPAGMFVGADTVERIIEDNSYIARLFATDKEKWLSVCFSLDKKAFEVFAKYKNRTDSSGPTEDIDYDMEKRVMEKNNLKR